MDSIYLGADLDTGRAFYLNKSIFRQHLHLPGFTGQGKTTLVLRMLHELLRDQRDPACHFIIDFMGNFSYELLLWVASPFCPESVRRRLVFICPGMERAVLGFNPLVYETQSQAYYCASRAMELILRGWRSQDLEAMPRLARWLFNAFHSAQLMGLTVADTMHLLLPRHELRSLIFGALPESLRLEWDDLYRSGPSEVQKTLDSTRNRLKPYYASDILRLMFSSTTNRADFRRFIAEDRIVLMDLSSHNCLTPLEANALAGLFLNELLTTARGLPPHLRRPVYCWLDEFQRVITGPDLEFAIPEVRQLGIRLICAHQSFSQLKRGEVDLTSLIWQLQTRFTFAAKGDDADLLAHELASLTYDPKKIKDEFYTRRQLMTGQRLMDLASEAHTRALAQNWQDTYGRNDSSQNTYVDGLLDSTRRGSGHNYGHATGGGSTTSDTYGTHQALVPVYEEFMELCSRTYYSFDEQRQHLAREVRKLVPGQVLLTQANSPDIIRLAVDESRPGPLRHGLEQIATRFPQLQEAYEKLLEDNFAQRDLFVSPAEIEAETAERIARVLRPAITVTSRPAIQDENRLQTSDPEPFE